MIAQFGRATDSHEELAAMYPPIGGRSHTVIAHRQCLADRIHPDNPGERARAMSVGRRRD